MLLVEDNQTDVLVITEALERSELNLKVHVLRDGLDALTYLRQVGTVGGPPCPVLVLLDLNLPKVNGIEVLRQLRNSSCRDTAVIVVSSSDSQSDRDAVRALGAAAYFRKPTDLKAYMDLAHIVNRILIR